MRKASEDLNARAEGSLFIVARFRHSSDKANPQCVAEGAFVDYPHDLGRDEDRIEVGQAEGVGHT
jgi:hypothetical protein